MENRPKISDLLALNSINLNLVGSDKDSVLNELVIEIKEIAKRPDAQKTLLDALKEREKLHSTGIGDGVALPHSRNGLVGLVDHPVVIFGRHEKGINYGAIDGRDAHLFFLLIAPTVTEHLGIIARLSRLLRNPKLRQALMVAENQEKVLGIFRDAEAAG